MRHQKTFRSIVSLLIGCVMIGCEGADSRSEDSATSDPIAVRSTVTAEPVVAQAEQQIVDSDKASTSEVSDGQTIPMRGTEVSWPRLLGSHFDGVAPASQVSVDWTSPPQVTWTLFVGEGYGLGSVSDQTYYHFDATSSGGRAVQRIRAIDLETGTEDWSAEKPFSYNDLYGYENGPRGTPAIANDRLVSYGVDGELTCRRRSDGKELWSVSTSQTYGVVQNFFGVGASPLILDGRVIVTVGGSPPEDQQIAPGRLDRVISNGSALVAFDLESGDELWKAGEDLASYSSPRPMMIDGKQAILAFCRDHLMAIEPSDGTVLWKFKHRADKLESVNAMIPIVNNDQVFISECYDIGSALLKVTQSDASVVWKDESPSLRDHSMRCHWSTPVLIDGRLYGCSGRNNPDSDFRCVDLESGKVLWSDGRRRRSSVTQVGDVLLVMGEFGRLQVVRPNPERFELIAEYDLRDRLTSPSWAAPVVIGNRVLVRGNHRVLCLAFKS
ncbi:PQQ-binding-like beta-propeller repeat protein [Roseiconus lacunae]|uniref:PQQ-binding-like beta-propeller repeat protein n=2 Tax=Roseiconus lacunae TaxID=2605694 RepID=UPI001F230CD4|nr:PQQ-binding-like beta-propeller repeat protein [Roseiconus lacunae]